MRLEVMYQTPQTGHAKWIAGWIMSRNPPLIRVTRSDVVRAYPPMRAPEMAKELSNIMDGLVTLRWLREQETEGRRGRGIASSRATAWHVNPKVYTVFAEQGNAERARRREAQEQTGEFIRQRREV